MKITFILLAAFATASSAQASTVKFTLEYSSASLTYNLYVEDLGGSADNGGIGSYGAALTGVLTVDHKSPRNGFGQGPTGFGPAGFTSLRSADGVLPIVGVQDTITPTPNLIYGFGQSASSFAAKGIIDFTGGTQLESPTWNAKLLIASGTRAPDVIPSFVALSVDTFANVFVRGSGVAANTATIQTAVVDLYVPEPLSLAIAGVALVGMIGVARGRVNAQLAKRPPA